MKCRVRIREGELAQYQLWSESGLALASGKERLRCVKRRGHDAVHVWVPKDKNGLVSWPWRAMGNGYVQWDVSGMAAFSGPYPNPVVGLLERL